MKGLGAAENVAKLDDSSLLAMLVKAQERGMTNAVALLAAEAQRRLVREANVERAGVAA